MTNKDPIGNKLGLPLLQEQKIKNLLKEANSTSAGDDFEKARSNTLFVLDKLRSAIEDLSEQVSQSQLARDYEVLAKLIDVSINGGRNLLDLQSKIRNIEKTDLINQDNNEEEDYLFQGTTAEFQKIIKSYKEGEVIDIEKNNDEDN